MKVIKTEKFEPVQIVLETQEEVDKLFAIINHSRIADAVDLPNAWELLRPYRSDNYRAFFQKLQTRFTA
jgi:hypothetical protein